MVEPPENGEMYCLTKTIGTFLGQEIYANSPRRTGRFTLLSANFTNWMHQGKGFTQLSLTPCPYHIWLVVDLPFWKIWKSVGMIIPHIWEKSCSKPPTRHVRCPAQRKPKFPSPIWAWPVRNSDRDLWVKCTVRSLKPIIWASCGPGRQGHWQVHSTPDQSK